MAQILTDQDFQNAKIDIEDIGQSVNESMVITPRYGAPYKSIPLIVSEFQDAINTIVINDGVPALAVIDASGKTQQAINDEVSSFNGYVFDARKLGLIDSKTIDQAAAVTAINNYVNAIPVHKGIPVIVRLPSGYVKSSVGFSFDRQTILLADNDCMYEYTGTGGYAARFGKLGETDYINFYRNFGMAGVNLTGATAATHGIYFAEYVLAPILDKVYLDDFGNPDDINSYAIFFQAHNWDIYIRNCKSDWTTKNNVNLIRVNGVLTTGTPDYGNSRLNMIDSFHNQGGTASAGVGLYLNSFKSRLIGGGFQGFKTSVQLGEYAQTPEINGTYFETIYQDCESVFKIGDDGYTSEKVFSDISLLNIYANLHNINNPFGDTNVKFLTTTANVKLSNIKADNIKTLNGDKYPLLNLQALAGQTCDVGGISHGNALLHNVRDDQMVVVNPKENHIPNSDLKVWQRGSSFSYASGIKKIADGFALIGDGSTGNINVYNEPILDAYNFPKDAVGMMRLVRTAASTNGTYCTLRLRVGELDVLNGRNAVFSFVARADVNIPLTATLVREYGSNTEFISVGSFNVLQSLTASSYAKSFIIPPLNRGYARGNAARTYIEISLPLALLFVLDISCISLQEGIVKQGWDSKSYLTDWDIARKYYQSGGYNVIQTGQLKVQVDLDRMRYTPTVVANVVYQDAVVNYNASVGIAEQSKFTAQLNATATDVAINWTADAEVI